MQKTPTHRHIIFKVQKIKEKVQREARGKKLTSGGAKIRSTSNFPKHHWKREETGVKYLVLREKKNLYTNPEFNILQNYPSEVKKKDFLRQMNIQEIFCQ